MKEWAAFITDNMVAFINAIASLIIIFGTLEMAITCLHVAFVRPKTGHELRDGYLRYARWLMAGLTFQLATDIITSALAPSWDDIGRLAAIAVIRTFLNFFLERDILEASKAQDEPGGNDSKP